MINTINSEAATRGYLDLAVLPVLDQPAFVLPQSMVSAVLPYQEEETVLFDDKLVTVKNWVAETETGACIALVKRRTQGQFVALALASNPRKLRVRISLIKDAENESSELILAYQLVEIEGVLYQVPNIDRLMNTNLYV